MPTTQHRAFTWAIGFTCISCMGFGLLLALPPTAWSQQSQATLDLRNQLVPVPAEQVEAALFPIAALFDGEVPPFPVAIVVESISPVSQTTGNMIVDLVIQNRGSRTLSIPVSREMKVLHYAGNQDRRRLTCLIDLTAPPSSEEMTFGGFTTFSSSTAPSSVALIKAGESIRLRFETSFQKPWENRAEKWKASIGEWTVLAKLKCLHEVIRLDSGEPRR